MLCVILTRHTEGKSYTNVLIYVFKIMFYFNGYSLDANRKTCESVDVCFLQPVIFACCNFCKLTIFGNKDTKIPCSCCISYLHILYNVYGEP